LLATELSANRLEILLELAPKASRLAILWNDANPGMLLRSRETQDAATKLGQAIAFPSHTRGGSRMRESRTYGSVRGACGETHVPTATGLPCCTCSQPVLADFVAKVFCTGDQKFFRL